MANKRSLNLKRVKTLLSPSFSGITVVPVSAIKESDHAFFWGALYLSVATCLFGCAASLYAATYEHMPFILLVMVFGGLFLVLFTVFAFRGFHIRRKARAQERRIRPQEVAYQQSMAIADGNVGQDIQENIHRVLGDGMDRSREEVIGILSTMSNEEVDVGTLNQVVDTLVEVGMFTEKDNGSRTLLTFKPEGEAAAAP
ncbi:MAG: hypothetical protein ACQERN_03665 [Thermodesulfobacteriota bacterium]